MAKPPPFHPLMQIFQKNQPEFIKNLLSSHFKTAKIHEANNPDSYWELNV